MDDKTPEWVFDQEDVEGENESSSPSSDFIEENQFSAVPADEITSTHSLNEEEPQTEVLADSGSVLEEASDPVWEEESTVFEDENDFSVAPEEPIAVEETPVVEPEYIEPAQEASSDDEMAGWQMEDTVEEPYGFETAETPAADVPTEEVVQEYAEQPVEAPYVEPAQEEEAPVAFEEEVPLAPPMGEDITTEPVEVQQEEVVEASPVESEEWQAPVEDAESIMEVQAEELEPTEEDLAAQAHEAKVLERADALAGRGRNRKLMGGKRRLEKKATVERKAPKKTIEPEDEKPKNVSGSTFESAGWDMFGGDEEVVAPVVAETHHPAVDDSEFLSQLKEAEGAAAAESVSEVLPVEEVVELVDVMAEEHPAIEVVATENEAEDVLEGFEGEEQEEISALTEDTVIEEVDELLETNDLEEPSVDALNEEVEAILADDANASADMDENDGSIQEEDIFKADSLVLKRDTEKKKSTSIVENTVSSDDEDFYLKILTVLEESEDLGLTPATRQKIRDAMKSEVLPQLAIKELIAQRVIGKIQLARAATRSQGHQEIMSFLDVPAESSILRKELDPKAVAYLREQRIIPLSRETSSQGQSTLNLAYESAFRDLVKESDLRELLPGYRFFWHFALREVCGAFWLAGGDDDVDSSMEAEALLDRIVTNAIDARSSDIHVDPSIKGEPRAIVKYRIDGFVTPKEVITEEQLKRLRTRIENIARMPKVNETHPNKGAFSRAGFDWRVQIQPHAGRQGPVPRIVIRRLQPDVLPMETLGYPQYFIDDIQSAAASPNGVIFWTGPTGSGKTESIHSAIVSVNPMGKGLSVHTIEDPPEKRVSGYAVQMEMSDQDPQRSGMELLKSSLRADPDVVIFGEVRDEEMAGLVFEAANTGHLVFSTLHTNTALDAIVRLDELGIYGFLVSYIRGIAAQRLVRRLCVHCRQPLDHIDDFTKSVFDKYEVDVEGATLYRANPEGCGSCNHSGYHGRIAICEWLTPNKELVEISTRRDYDDLERVAVSAGWKPMAYMGVLHVKNGITDAEELASKVQELATEI